MEKGRTEIVYNAEPYGYSKNARQSIEKKGYSYLEGSWEEIEREGSFPDVRILIVRLKRPVDAGVLNKFPALQKVVSATTGHDHLDLNELKKRNIELISLRGHDDFLSTIPSTAEHTWALMMALFRKIPAAHTAVQNAEWNRDLYRGNQLKGKTIGIIGYGRTGRRVAKFADAFEMKVQFYDPFVAHANPLHQKSESLEDLLKISDIVSLHVHLNAETKNLLNKGNLNFLKNGAWLINTSRGLIWDEKVVTELLEEGRIAGVATDVLSTELQDFKESPLWKAQKEGRNVIITPHIGGATWEAMWSCEEYIVRHI